MASPANTHLLNATNVTVERYLATNRRAYRSLSSSVNTAGGNRPFINDNWQEGVNNTSLTLNVNGPLNGFGTHITGSTSGDNAFDATQTGDPSMFTYNGATAAYTSIPNTNATTLNAAMGYLLFVRGDRSTIERLNGSTTNASGSTTLRATGALVAGDVTYPLAGDNKFTLLTNPYASAIGWDKINPVGTSGLAGIGTSYIYVDPTINTRGGYVTVKNDGTASVPVTNASVNIQSGQAFFIKSDASGSPATLTITEAHKSTTNNINVFRTGSQEQMSIGLYFDLNGIYRVADGVTVLFNNNYSVTVDGNDAEQLTNFDEDISIKLEGKFLSIEGRPLIDQADTIFLNMTHMKKKDYTLEFNPASFNAPGLRAYLQDKFMDNETEISLTDLTIIPFTVSSNTASSVTDRFRLIFRNLTVLPINFTHVKAFEKGNSIQVEWNIGNEQNMKQYQVEKSIDGRTFTKAGSQVARTISSTDSYQWLDVTPNNGNNFYRIKAIENGGLSKYSQVVNVKTGKSNSAISVYPNPVTDRTINLQLINQAKGKYTITLLNQAGQQVYRKEINHIGGSASEPLLIGSKIAKGVYTLKVSGNGNNNSQKLVID